MVSSRPPLGLTIASSVSIIVFILIIIIIIITISIIIIIITILVTIIVILDNIWGPRAPKNAIFLYFLIFPI